VLGVKVRRGSGSPVTGDRIPAFITSQSQIEFGLSLRFSSASMVSRTFTKNHLSVDDFSYVNPSPARTGSLIMMTFPFGQYNSFGISIDLLGLRTRVVISGLGLSLIRVIILGRLSIMGMHSMGLMVRRRLKNMLLVITE